MGYATRLSYSLPRKKTSAEMTSYNDLGKPARDLLQRGFNDSKWKLGVTNILPHNFILVTSGYYDHVSKQSDANIDLELKVNSKVDRLNLSVKRGFSVRNGGSFSIAATGGDRWGVKNLSQSFNNTGKLAFSFHNDRFNGDVSLASLDSGYHSVTPTFCLSSAPFALGLTSNILAEEASCVGTSVGFAFTEKNFAASIHLYDDAARASGCLYGRANDSVELAARVGFDLETAKPSAEAGLRYTIEKGFSVTSKLSHDLKLALNSCRDVTSGVRLSASLVFDVGGLSLAQTKLGLGIDIGANWRLIGGRGFSTPPSPSPPTP